MGHAAIIGRRDHLGRRAFTGRAVSVGRKPLIPQLTIPTDLHSPSQSLLVAKDIVYKVAFFRAHLPVCFDDLFSSEFMSAVSLPDNANAQDLEATEKLMEQIPLRCVYPILAFFVGLTSSQIL